jgi:hypothetical protein
MSHVDVDERVVAHDLALGRVNEPHATHIGGELIHLVELCRPAIGQPECLLAIPKFPEIEDSEIIRRGG